MTQLKPVDQKSPSWQRTTLLATDSSHSIIVEIVDGRTNAIAYSAYGQQSGQQEVITHLGLNGQLREMQTSWYLLGNGYRAYNPRLMRFHSPDSWSPFGWGGLNPYTYCVGDPVNHIDPTGHVGVLRVISSALQTAINYARRRANTLFDHWVSSSPVTGRGALGNRPMDAAPSISLRRTVPPTEEIFGSISSFSRPYNSPPAYFSHDPGTFSYKKLIPNTLAIFDGTPPAYTRRMPRPSVRPPPPPPPYTAQDMSPLIDSDISRQLPQISTRTDPSHMVEQIRENNSHASVAIQNDPARISRIQRLVWMRENS
ncbi:RHS repeat-associated core domain-containing protein [Pseudomonas serbica]